MIKMKRKIMSLTMTVAMITTLFAGMTISASAAWTGTIDTTWYDPSSSVTSYTLSDGAELAGLAAIVNGNTAVLNNASYLDANLISTLDSSYRVMFDSVLNALVLEEIE